MRLAPRLSVFALALLCSTSMLQACATGTTKRTGTEIVDRVFHADTILRKELHDTAKDIIKRHDGSGVAIVVKYHLVTPYTSSADLAQAQGKAVQDFLVEQGVKTPTVVSISPSSDPTAQIWISYPARREKGNGVVFDP